MNLDIDTKLNNTRSLLNELGNSVATLVNSSPDVFEEILVLNLPCQASLQLTKKHYKG